MPIQLTAAFNPGDILPPGPYTHAKIVAFTMLLEEKRVEITVRHGTYVNNEWVNGAKMLGQTLRFFSITGESYDDMVEEASAAIGEVYYNEVARLLYEWLMATYPEYAGTVV